MAFCFSPSVRKVGKSLVPHRRPVCCLAASKTRQFAHVLSRRALILGTAALCQPVIAMTVDSQGPRKDEGERRKTWWPPPALKKMFAFGMESAMGDYELAMASRKRALFSKLMPNTTVLDIGIGTGPNLLYLPNNVHCVGLDPNEYMRPYAVRKASNLTLRNIDLEVIQGNAENIPASDNFFDAVIWCVYRTIRCMPSSVLDNAHRS
jgi:Methyltransferase domain